MALSMVDNINPLALSQQSYGVDGPTARLTAVLSEATLAQQDSMQYEESSMFISQSYYTAPQAFQQTGYTPIEEPAIQQAPQETPAPAHQSNKRSLSSSDSEHEGTPSKRRRNESSSPKLVRRPRRGQSRGSDSSSESSLGHSKQLNFACAGERPNKDSTKPWVRINGNTKGETTRSARINAEAARQLYRKYKYKPLPNGYWKTRKFEFEYVNSGSFDEFKQKKMSARQVMEYITQYPTDDLRLWLQVAPADMARRYASPAHSKCLFKDRPKHAWGDSGTIQVGHYRVAFDEKFRCMAATTS